MNSYIYSLLQSQSFNPVANSNPIESYELILYQDANSQNIVWAEARVSFEPVNLKASDSRAGNLTWLSIPSRDGDYYVIKNMMIQEDLTSMVFGITESAAKSQANNYVIDYMKTFFPSELISKQRFNEAINAMLDEKKSVTVIQSHNKPQMKPERMIF